MADVDGIQNFGEGYSSKQHQEANSQSISHLSRERLNGLAEAVFGIASTGMILTISWPDSVEDAVQDPDELETAYTNLAFSSMGVKFIAFILGYHGVKHSRMVYSYIRMFAPGKFATTLSTISTLFFLYATAATPLAVAGAARDDKAGMLVFLVHHAIVQIFTIALALSHLPELRTSDPMQKDDLNPKHLKAAIKKCIIFAVSKLVTVLLGILLLYVADVGYRVVLFLISAKFILAGTFLLYRIFRDLKSAADQSSKIRRESVEYLGMYVDGVLAIVLTLVLIELADDILADGWGPKVAGSLFFSTMVFFPVGSLWITSVRLFQHLRDADVGLPEITDYSVHLSICFVSILPTLSTGVSDTIAIRFVHGICLDTMLTYVQVLLICICLATIPMWFASVAATKHMFTGLTSKHTLLYAVESAVGIVVPIVSLATTFDTKGSCVAFIPMFLVLYPVYILGVSLFNARRNNSSTNNGKSDTSMDIVLHSSPK